MGLYTTMFANAKIAKFASKSPINVTINGTLHDNVCKLSVQNLRKLAIFIMLLFGHLVATFCNFRNVDFFVVDFCVTVQKNILIFLSIWNCANLCTFHSVNSPIN